MASSSSKGRALRQFILSSSKSAGRNSSGHITIFHRGGGAKRLQRSIDLKRSTSSIGVVERIEYDPNRSSRIALVRWIEGVQQGRPRKCNIIEEFAPPAPRKILEPTTTTIRGPFSFSSLPGKVDQRKVASFSPRLMAGYAVVGLPTGMPPWSKGPFTSKGAGSQKTCAKDVFFSALSSPKAMGETAPLSFSSSFGFPRIAVQGLSEEACFSRTEDSARKAEVAEILNLLPSIRLPRLSLRIIPPHPLLRPLDQEASQFIFKEPATGGIQWREVEGWGDLDN
ncbi:hypothetical protein RHGRI_019570 [Rhododendron griersonianum]|uniref:60S ribosomal protein L2, mitochondrial n=1 Tax=Rhododendron griersonianum TaxID=479676 RepID=A0AAV6JIE7_9ERIC|nr:hypothetical protein RHGRI_019570 [Rhododendron griersonianum]